MLDSGKVFISGNNGASNNKFYRNAKGRVNDNLKIREPVLIFDGEAKNVIPYDPLCVLIITKDNTLYRFDDFTLVKIAENVMTAAAEKQSSYESALYYIDLSHRLYCANEKGNSLITTGVKSVKMCNEQVYCITDENTLCLLEQSRGSEISLTPILENVADFSVIEKRVLNVEEKNSSSLLVNALTLDGKLLTKGTYYSNYYYSLNSNDTSEGERNYSDWTLISEDVVQFVMSSCGTAYITRDGIGKYFGFNFAVEEQFLDVVLLENCLDISGNDQMLTFKTDVGWIIWGENPYIVASDGELPNDLLSKFPLAWKNNLK